MAFQNRLPGNAQKTGGNSTTDVYVTPDGFTYMVDKSTGNIVSSSRSGETNDFSVSKDVLGNVRSATDTLGITTPDPHNSPEFQQIMDAAKAFREFYNQDRQRLNTSEGNDLDTIARLRAAEEGKTPTQAEALMRKMLDQGAGQALGVAATLGGSNPGAALRMGMEAQQSTLQKSSADIAALRAQEEEAARALLAHQTGQNLATNAAVTGQTGQTYSGIVGAPYGAVNQANASNQALWGNVLSAASNIFSGRGGGSEKDKEDQTNASGLSESDIAAKKDVGDGSAAADAFLSTLPRGAAPTAADPRSIENQAADSFLSTLDPKTYRYKQPDINKPPGQRLGVMANDLPAQDVVTGPDGKKWISANVIGDVLAGMGRMHERVQKLEKSPPGATGGGAMIPDSAVHDYLRQLGITAD